MPRFPRSAAVSQKCQDFQKFQDFPEVPEIPCAPQNFLCLLAIPRSCDVVAGQRLLHCGTARASHAVATSAIATFDTATSAASADTATSAASADVKLWSRKKGVHYLHCEMCD